MKKKPFYAILLLLLLVGAFVAGSWSSRREGARVDPSVVKSAAVNPEKATDTNPDTGTSSLPPGAVRIISERQQAIGVRVSPVEKKPFTHTLRVLGRVAADETVTYRLNAAAEGWVRELFPVTVGSPVKKGQALASCYNRELLATGQAYLAALAVADRFPEVSKEPPAQVILPRATPPRVALHLAEDALRSLGMGDTQVEEMKRTRQLVQYITLVSPATGFVLARNVSPSQWFDRGTELYRIADLSRIWILADIYENEGRHFRPGMKVKVSLPNQGREFPARVSDVLPQFDPATRTLKLRLEADNPDYIMRPDMFVDLELPVQMPPAITVPADAILDSGLKKTIFVDLGNGYFEPREVETGSRIGNRVEVTKGLEPGEKIVTSGTFLVDSESKLEMTAQGMYTTLGKDPVCGIEVAIRKAEKAGLKTSHGGKTYYFHSDECKDQFQKNPAGFLKSKR